MLEQYHAVTSPIVNNRVGPFISGCRGDSDPRAWGGSGRERVKMGNALGALLVLVLVVVVLSCWFHGKILRIEGI